MSIENLRQRYQSFCKFPHCRSKRCAPLNSEFCFEHTSGNKHIKQWKLDAKVVETLTPKEILDYFEQKTKP